MKLFQNPIGVYIYIYNVSFPKKKKKRLNIMFKSKNIIKKNFFY